MADQEAPAYVRNDCKTTFEQNLTFAQPDDTKDDFDEITFETAFSEYKSYMHAVQGMLYSMGQRLLWGRYTQPGDILVRTAPLLLSLYNKMYKTIKLFCHIFPFHIFGHSCICHILSYLTLSTLIWPY